MNRFITFLATETLKCTRTFRKMDIALYNIIDRPSEAKQRLAKCFHLSGIPDVCLNIGSINLDEPQYTDFTISQILFCRKDFFIGGRGGISLFLSKMGEICFSATYRPIIIIFSKNIMYSTLHKNFQYDQH